MSRVPRLAICGMVRSVADSMAQRTGPRCPVATDKPQMAGVVVRLRPDDTPAATALRLIPVTIAPAMPFVLMLASVPGKFPATDRGLLPVLGAAFIIAAERLCALSPERTIKT
ncbi:MAG: hypothetical protein ACK4VZ_14660 [Paracoccaceae bacterium]